jgi:hypothetical protein
MRKIADMLTSTIPKVPEMISVKNKMEINTAISSRIVLSTLPIFFFITINLDVLIKVVLLVAF